MADSKSRLLAELAGGVDTNGRLDSASLDSDVAVDANLNSFISTFTLPTTDGSADQVLKTDGSATLSFTTVSGGGGGASLSAVNTLDSRNVTADTTISGTESAFSVGPLTIDDTKTLTISSGGRLVIM